MNTLKFSALHPSHINPDVGVLQTDGQLIHIKEHSKPYVMPRGHENMIALDYTGDIYRKVPKTDEPSLEEGPSIIKTAELVQAGKQGTIWFDFDTQMNDYSSPVLVTEVDQPSKRLQYIA